MDKVNIYNLKGNKIELIERPKIFNLRPRKDLIKKAVEVAQCHRIREQDFGTWLRGGERVMECQEHQE